MPPKAAVPVRPPPSPTPPPAPAPPSVSDASDILIIQDFMDTVDQIPVELTRVHSDLNELGAVLYSTLCNLERKLHQLIDWVQNPRIGPEKRFQLLQEIAEEAARYKLGGDDKIRVAGGACDGIMAHQRHISALLASSTLLNAEPPSPYTAMLTLPPPPVQPTTRRGGRTNGSPFNDRGTPTKRKKKTKDVLKDDDDTSSIAGKDDKKKQIKRKKTNRAASPTDSIASGTYGKADPAPRTARQIAAAAAKARAAQKVAEDTDDDSNDEEPRRGKPLPMQVSASTDSLAPTSALGVDLGASGEGSATKSGGTTPAAAGDKRRVRGVKRGREDEDEEEEEEPEDEARPAKRSGGTTSKKAATYDEVEVADEGTGGENEVDSKVYCTCRQVSYGEMIGCDAPPGMCKVEWFHIQCVGLTPPLPETWYCPDCTVLLKNSNDAKKGRKSRKK